MSDYPVGTVATATVRGVEGVRVMRIGASDESPYWISSDTVRGATFHAPDQVTDIHPLVTLDLHGQEISGDPVAQLRSRADYDAGANPFERHTLYVIAEQIGAQTRPTKPPEPQGLGAVVEDGDGVLWVRARDEKHHWRPAHETGTGLLYRPYGEIAVVRVLSEGVTP